MTFRVDEPRQLLLITADDQALVPQVLGEEIAVGPPDRTSLGAVLNYDIYGNFGGQHAVAGLFDMQINVLQGTLESGLLVQSPDASPAVRLSTSFLLPDFGGQRDWTLGDVVSGGLSWTRPFRLGGGQVQSSFAMRPDIVTMPLPVLGGRTAVPSTVDVMVDGVREFSEGVQSGPFVIRQPPMLNGAGDYTVVIRDPLGQQTAQTVPFYISPALLAPGLSSYSVETGLVRNGYATPNDQYGQAVGSASLRYGLSSLFHRRGASGGGTHRPDVRHWRRRECRQPGYRELRRGRQPVDRRAGAALFRRRGTCRQILLRRDIADPSHDVLRGCPGGER